MCSSDLKGERIINMIHRDDVVGVIIAALERGQAGTIYNAADDEAVSQFEFFRFLAGLVGKPMPPFATEAENASRKRGLTNKRVANQRVKAELGYEFRYPNFRAGYSAEAERVAREGRLNLQ